MPLLRRQPLFGPVLFYDLVRIARRSRFAFLRGAYAAFLLLTLLLVYLNFHEDAWRGAVRAQTMAQLAESFFRTFMAIQFLAVYLFTPAYTAGAIAEEKERKTLEFLLATDLNNREIVLSKQLVRLGNMALLILTGLPILAMMQFLGGVDPDLVVIGFAATGLTMLGLGSLSILCSVYAKRTRNAIMLTYLTMLAYVCVSGIAVILVGLDPQVAGLPVWFGSDPPTLQDVVNAVSVANPFVVVFRMESVFSGGRPLGEFVADEFPVYAIFFGVVSLACTAWSVLRLRAVALRQASGPARAARGGRWRERAPVGDRPVVWKELRVERGLHLNWVGWVAVALVAIVSFVPLVMIGVSYFSEPRPYPGNYDWVSYAINSWVRGVGTLVACLTLLGVAFRASGSITGERDRQTLDSLLTSPLDSRDILYGKWLGSVFGMRWGWAWLGLIWGLGIVTGGMHVLALPLLIVAWFVFAAFLAVLGLWFSVVSRTTLRANIGTLLAATGLAFGHWLPWVTCCLPFQMFAGGDGLEHLAKFQAFGLTPPVTLGWLAFHGEEFNNRYSGGAVEFMLDSLVGLLVWGVGAVVLWGVVNERFRRMTNRAPLLPRPVPPTSPPPAAGGGEPSGNADGIQGVSPSDRPDS